MRRYSSYSEYLSSRYGEKVYRIGVDGHFSCPNRDKNGGRGCSFCDAAGAISVYHRDKEKDGKWTALPPERLSSIEAQIKRGKEFLIRRYGAKSFILYFQAFTNTYASMEELKAVYDSAFRFGPFMEFIVSTRPDEIDDGKCELLSSYKSQCSDVWVELGLQSSNEKTLKALNRGHGVESFVTAANMLAGHGVKVSAHVMLIPFLDSREDYKNTARLLSSLPVSGAKIHNLHVTRGTGMEESFLSSGCMNVSSFQEAC